MIKTGECYYRDWLDILWFAESFVDEHGNVTTIATEILE